MTHTYLYSETSMYGDSFLLPKRAAVTILWWPHVSFVPLAFVRNLYTPSNNPLIHRYEVPHNPQIRIDQPQPIASCSHPIWIEILDKSFALISRRTRHDQHQKAIPTVSWCSLYSKSCHSWHDHGMYRTKGKGSLDALPGHYRYHVFRTRLHRWPRLSLCWPRTAKKASFFKRFLHLCIYLSQSMCLHV